MPLRDTLRFHSCKPFKLMLAEGVKAGEAYGVSRLLGAVQHYKTASLRDGEPVVAPAPIAAGGRAGSEGLFLLGNMIRQAQDAKVAAPTLLGAWERLGSPAQ